MLKVYQEKTESEELFLRLMQGCERARLRIVNPFGEPAPGGALLQLTKDGVRLSGNIDPTCAARAGLTNAFDANGRLKVIGQEVEAERFSKARYQCAFTPTDGLEILHDGDGDLEFITHDGDHQASVYLDPTALRCLRDNLSAHLAFLEQEGLA
jgi:hypothetical protein